MKRFLVLALLVLAMLGIDFLQKAGGATLAATFAAVGFAILAAYALAEIVSALKMPKVTGYILAGILIGPQVSELVSRTAADQMKIFNSLALALIALEAGLELSLDAIKKVGRTLLSMVALKIPLSWLMIGGAFLVASPLLPWGADMSFNELLTIGLVLGALGVGTSPAVSIAVISETGAKGRTPDVILSMAVFKDFVMIIMLALAIAIGNVLITPGAAMEGAIFAELGKKVGLSLVVGIAVGGLLIAWMRWVRWEMLLTLLIVAYGVELLSEILHLKPLLVFIAAGFTVNNFSRYGHDLHKPLSLLALPVFIVFFTTAGANLDLEALWAVLPVAAILFAARLLMFFVSAEVGGRLAKDTPRFRRRIWLGFVSQGGVALGLLLIAQDGLAPLSEPMGQIAIALIALNLLIGPAILRPTLTSAQADEAPAEPAALDADGHPDAPALVAQPPHPEAPEPLPELEDATTPDDEALVEVLDRIRGTLEGLAEELDGTLIGPWQAYAHDRLDLVEAGEVASVREALRPMDLVPSAERLAAAAREVRDELSALPPLMLLPIRDYHLEAPDNPSPRQRLEGWLLRVRNRGGKARRRVELRHLARTRVEGALLPDLADLLDLLARAEAARLDGLRERCQNAEGGAAVDAIRAIVDARAEQLRAALARAARHATLRLAEGLRLAGTPLLPARRYRYADVASGIDASLKHLDYDADAWNRILEGVAGRADLRVTLTALESRVGAEMEEAVARWSAGQRQNLSAVVEEVHASLGACHQRLSDKLDKLPASRARDMLGQEAKTVEALIWHRAMPRVEELREAESSERSFSALGSRLAGFVAELDERTLAVDRELDAQRIEDPTQIKVRDVDLRAIAKKHLEGELAWALADAGATAGRTIEQVSLRLGEVTGIVSYGIQSSIARATETQGERQSGPLAEEIRALAIESVDRARRGVETLLSELSDTIAAMPETMDNLTHDAFAHIYLAALGEARERVVPISRGERFKKSTTRAWRQASDGWQAFVESMRTVYRRAVESEAARNARMRSGAEHVDPQAMATEVAALGASRAQFKKLPYVLGKLFDPSALDTPKVLASARPQEAAIELGFERFDAGETVSMLLTGAAGSGKTSVAFVTLTRLMKTRLVTVGLGPVERTEAGLSSTLGADAGVFGATTFEQLELGLKSKRMVILLDGLEEIFIRTPAGLRHIRRLLELISRTRDHICWVVAVNSPTAALLDRLADLRGYFSDHIFFPPLGGDAIAEVIDARCRLSGFEVRWPQDEGGWWRRVLSTPDQEENRRRYLIKLAQKSGGNIRDALSLWLNAIDHVDEQVIAVGPIRAPALAWFDQLGRDAHRVLALVVVCGTATPDEAREALRWTSDRVNAALTRLQSAGLLVDVPDEPHRFRLVPSAWRRVTELLQDKNELIPPEAR